MYGYVYCRIFPNNKCYIGITTRNPKERWMRQNSEARRGYTNCAYLYNALRKYNYQTKDYIIAYAINEKDLSWLEKQYIKLYNSIKEGYNLAEGGFNGKHSEETIKKYKKLHKQKKIGFYNREHTEQQKKKWSIERSGKKRTIKNKKNNSIANQKTGKFKIAGAILNKNANPEKKAWRSVIVFNGRRKYLGSYEDPFTAGLVYNLVWEELYGGIL